MWNIRVHVNILNDSSGKPKPGWFAVKLVVQCCMTFLLTRQVAKALFGAILDNSYCGMQIKPVRLRQ